MKKSSLAFLLIGICLLGLFLLMSFFPMLFTSYDRKENFDAWLMPSFEHILGTNNLGYDIFTELCYGAKDTIAVGLLSSLLSIALGFVIGIISSGNSLVSKIFEGLTSIFLLMPKLIAMIVLAGFVGDSRTNLIILIALFTWAPMARELRAKIQGLKEKPFIKLCELYGYSKLHIAIYHIFPNLVDILSSKFLLGTTSCIMMESSLSFLGFGDSYYPSWGVMINFARNRGALLRGFYPYILAPCICICLLALSFYFISIYLEAKSKAI